MTGMHPLSLVFRVDAADTDDARRQLTDTIRTAGRLLGALGGPLPPVEPQPTVKPSNNLGPGALPWVDDMRGMGE